MAITTCPEKWCRRPFHPGETACPDCGSLKPSKTVHLICVGGPERECAVLDDVIDNQLNSGSFTGQMSMRLTWIEPGRWRLGDVAHQPPPTVPRVLSARECAGLIRMAVEGHGFTLVE